MNSEELRKQSASEDNDIKAYGIYVKSIRQSKQERFEIEYLPKILAKGIDVENENIGKYTLLNTSFGAIDFFPKANKILIRKDNRWVESGTSWLIKNIL